MKKSSRKSQEQSLKEAEVQARKEIENVFEATSRALGRPPRRGTSRMWIPIVTGVALVAGLGLALFALRIGPFAALSTTKAQTFDH